MSVPSGERTDEVRVAAVLVNYNGGVFNDACLDSLAASDLAFDSIIVIDNASTDGSVDALKARSDGGLVIIENAENTGFARACNQGMRQALGEGADFVFLMNNDARLQPDTLGRLVHAAGRHPKAGLFGGKIYLGSGPELWCAGMDVGFHPNLQNLRGFGATDDGRYDREETVDALTGCGLLLRRRFIEEVGVFDEDYFVYVEDLDLSVRAAKQGWDCVYVPEAHIFHDAGSSSGPGYSAWRKYMLAYNLVLFLRKHGSFSHWLAFWLLDVLCWPLVLLAGILSGRNRGAMAKGRGLAHGLLGKKADPPAL